MCIHFCNWCTPLILNGSLWPPQCKDMLSLLTLLRTWLYHPPLCKPQSSKQGLCFLFLYSRHKRAAETDNNFTHVPLYKWRWWYKSVLCVHLLKVAKQGVICIVVKECTYNCSVGLLPFSYENMCMCVCVCVCERERAASPPSVSVSLILTVPVLGVFPMWILESDLECKVKQKIILLTVNFNERKIYMY